METKDYGLSLNPDESMRWIYDQRRPEYYSKQAEDLRDRRAYALRHAPKWMIHMAEMNDEMRKLRQGA